MGRRLQRKDKLIAVLAALVLIAILLAVLRHLAANFPWSVLE